MRRIWGVVLLAIAALFAASAVVGAQGEVRNSTVGTFELAADATQIDELTFDVEFQDAGDALFVRNNHVVGGLTVLSDGTTIYAGFETLDEQRWASLIIRYADQAGFDGGEATQVGPGIRQVDDGDRERRVAVPFEWVEGVGYTFTLTRADAVGGSDWSVSVSDGGGVTAVGTQFVPESVAPVASVTHSIVQRTDFGSACDDAGYVWVTIGDVAWSGPAGVSSGFLSRGYVEANSCAASEVALAASGSSVVHELAGFEGFQGGALGTGIDLVGDFVVGSDVNSAYPYCLANIGETGTLRVCFASDGEREQNILAIVDSPSRPPGETIWIGPFDREVVRP